MKQIELTSKLVVALIAIVVFSAMTVPTLAQSALRIPNSFITSGMIKDGEVKTNDLADSAVTSPKIADGTIEEEDIADGVIPSGDTQPKLYVASEEFRVSPGAVWHIGVDCEEGDLVTGGGYDTSESNIYFDSSFPFEQGWRVAADTSQNTGGGTVRTYAVCLDLTP